MANVNASGKVVSVVEAEDGKVTVGIDSARTNGTGEPSFKLSYEFPAGTPANTLQVLDTIVEFSITTTPPVLPEPEPVPVPEPAPEVTPEPAETPVEAPVAEPAAPVEETPVEAPAEPVAAPEPVVEPAPVEDAPPVA